jgi:hypothetical protein
MSIYRLLVAEPIYLGLKMDNLIHINAKGDVNETDVSKFVCFRKQNNLFLF